MFVPLARSGPTTLLFLSQGCPCLQPLWCQFFLPPITYFQIVTKWGPHCLQVSTGYPATPCKLIWPTPSIQSCRPSLTFLCDLCCLTNPHLLMRVNCFIVKILLGNVKHLTVESSYFRNIYSLSLAKATNVGLYCLAEHHKAHCKLPCSESHYFHF